MIMGPASQIALIGACLIMGPASQIALIGACLPRWQRVQAAALPASSGCAAASVPATGLSLRSPRAAIDLSPLAGVSLVPASPARPFLVPAGNILAARVGRCAGPFLHDAWRLTPGGIFRRPAAHSPHGRTA